MGRNKSLTSPLAASEQAVRSLRADPGSRERLGPPPPRPGQPRRAPALLGLLCPWRGGSSLRLRSSWPAARRGRRRGGKAEKPGGGERCRPREFRGEFRGAGWHLLGAEGEGASPSPPTGERAQRGARCSSPAASRAAGLCPRPLRRIAGVSAGDGRLPSVTPGSQETRCPAGPGGAWGCQGTEGAEAVPGTSWVN